MRLCSAGSREDSQFHDRQLRGPARGIKQAVTADISPSCRESVDHAGCATEGSGAGGQGPEPHTRSFPWGGGVRAQLTRDEHFAAASPASGPPGHLPLPAADRRPRRLGCRRSQPGAARHRAGAGPRCQQRTCMDVCGAPRPRVDPKTHRCGRNPRLANAHRSARRPVTRTALLTRPSSQGRTY